MEGWPVMPSVFDSANCPAKCLDCGLDYDQFGMDTQVPRAQWLTIHPDEGGLLCATCIVRRIAQRLPGATLVHLITEVSGGSAKLHAIVNAQAEDEGLWFQARTAPEAYLQQELRRLHAAIEEA
jgi:hypothetical protein